MGAKTTYETFTSKPGEHLKPKNKDVVIGIPIKNVDDVISSILPNENEIPKNLRESLFKKMSIMKYADKIFKELYCLESKNNESDMCGIRYYLVFLSEKKDDAHVNFAYYFLYEKNVIDKKYVLKKKGDKILSKTYIDELDEINKLFGAGKTKEFLEEINNNMIKAREELENC